MREANLEVPGKKGHTGDEVEQEAGRGSCMQQVEDDDEDTSDYDSEDSDNPTPVPGGDLLQ